VQRGFLQQVWQEPKKTYDRIATDLGYSSSYIKQTIAPELWQILSAVIGENVKKNNFRVVVQKRLSNLQSQQTHQLIDRLKKRLEPYEHGSVQRSVPQTVASAQPSAQLIGNATCQYAGLPGSGCSSPSDCQTAQKIEQGEAKSLPFCSDYIPRIPEEPRCYEEILKPGALIHIESPKHMGSTSLMTRTLAYAKMQNYQTVYLDFSQADQDILADLDRLLRWFAYQVTYKLGLKLNLEDYWQTEWIGSKGSCHNYFQEYLLPQIETGLVLGLDEINELLRFPNVAQDFIRLVRSWHHPGIYPTRNSLQKIEKPGGGGASNLGKNPDYFRYFYRNLFKSEY
jgi:hypothetical protein